VSADAVRCAEGLQIGLDVEFELVGAIDERESAFGAAACTGETSHLGEQFPSCGCVCEIPADTRRAIVKCCGWLYEKSQAATFSSVVVFSLSVVLIPSWYSTLLSTSVTSSWPVNLRQRSWAVSKSL
jgi:hypothetical protein